MAGIVGTSDSMLQVFETFSARSDFEKPTFRDLTNGLAWVG